MDIEEKEEVLKAEHLNNAVYDTTCKIHDLRSLLKKFGTELEIDEIIEDIVFAHGFALGKIDKSE